MPICVNSEGSGESAHLHRLTIAFATTSLVLPKMAISVLFGPEANTLVSLHICTGKVTGNAISIKISFAGSEGSWESTRLHRLA